MSGIGWNLFGVATNIPLIQSDWKDWRSVYNRDHRWKDGKFDRPIFFLSLAGRIAGIAPNIKPFSPNTVAYIKIGMGVLKTAKVMKQEGIARGLTAGLLEGVIEVPRVFWPESKIASYVASVASLTLNLDVFTHSQIKTLFLKPKRLETLSRSALIAEIRKNQRLQEFLKNSARFLPWRCAMNNGLLLEVYVLKEGEWDLYYDKISIEEWVRKHPNKAPNNWPQQLMKSGPLRLDRFKPDVVRQNALNQDLDHEIRLYQQLLDFKARS